MKKYLLYIGICYHKPKRCHFAVHLGTKTLGYVEIDSESFQTILRGKLVSLLFCISSSDGSSLRLGSGSACARLFLGCPGSDFF